MHPFTKQCLQRAEALTKMRAKNPSLNRSIHPRVEGGRQRHEKVNTCKPRKHLIKKNDELARR